METRSLIDAIMRQTTVLIAQLSTSAGLRAPLAHMADQVFLDLAREIEAQGVSRKVVADMFGLALRSYQKKMRRLTASAERPDQTLWQAVVDHIVTHGDTSRADILAFLHEDDEGDVAAVLRDLVDSGVLFVSGKGASAIYGATSAKQRSGMDVRKRLESERDWVWYEICRRPRDRAALHRELDLEASALDRAVDRLVQEGHVKKGDDGMLRAEQFTVAVGADCGWEMAVFDHFRAMTRAIGAKLQAGPRSGKSDQTGGGTLRFDLGQDHPLRDEVLGCLDRVRGELSSLWDRVEAENAQNPPSEATRTEVYFYFGQHTCPSGEAEPQDEP